jgi:hypothetical protein
LLLSGWIIVLAALVLLRSEPSLASFVLAGVGLEAGGLGLLFRSHRIEREDAE